ncbi:MAG: HPP family protein [Pirellulales bacterium]
MTNSEPIEQSTMDRLDSKRLQVLSALEAMWHTTGGQPLTAEQVMTTTPVCVSRETTLPELVEIFHERHFRHLLVADDEGRLQGVISDRDVLRMMGPGTAYKEVLEGILAGEIMSADLVTIGPRTSMTEAIGSLVDHGISCLPVVDSGRLVGIVTSTDLHVLLQMLLQAIRSTGSEQPATAAGP